MDLAVVGLTSLGQVSGTGVVKEIAAAYTANNHSAFESAAARMNALIEGMDAIAGTQVRKSQLQPFVAASSQGCVGQLASFRPS
jgi:hypothetical protein